MKHQITTLVDFVFHFLPVNRNKFYFRAYNGQYSDNPKYISQKLHEIKPDTEIYWELSDASKRNDLPDYIKVVNQGTIYQCYVKNRCRYIVETGMGYYLDYKPKRLSYLIKKFILTNKKQFNLSTWHGTPIKCIGAQIKGYESWNKDNVITTSNGVLSGSSYLTSIIKKAFVGICPILELGTPRTDILFKRTEKQKSDLKKKLEIPCEKKVILYAPTFRNTIEDSGITQLKMMDIPVLLNVLEKKFNGKWVFVMRAHPLIQDTVNEFVQKLNMADRFISGNKYEDMMEYLSIADILLTDFSSSAYDFSVVDRPCFLYAHDRVEYESNDRGIYELMSFLPYHFSDTFEDLLTSIKDYDHEQADKRRQAFLKKIVCREDGRAAERAVSLLLEN